MESREELLLKKYKKEFEEGLDTKGLFKLRNKLYRLSNGFLSGDEIIDKWQLLICIKELIEEDRKCNWSVF